MWGAGAVVGGPVQGTIPLRAQHSPQQGPKPRSPDKCHLQATCALCHLLRALCPDPRGVFSPVISPVAGTVLPGGSTVVNSCSSAAKQLCDFVCDCSDCSDENHCGGYPAPPSRSPASPAPLPGPAPGARAGDGAGGTIGAGPWGGCWSLGWVQDPRVGAGVGAGAKGGCRTPSWVKVPQVGTGPRSGCRSLRWA